MTAVIRVLVADDQVLVRDGFRSIIEREPDLTVVGEASDGREAIALTRSLRPDVVVMDIQMPGLDGLAASERLLAEADAPRILILTTFDRNEYVYRAMCAGASGFLLKDVRSGQLTEAIRTVALGEALLSPSITRRLIEDFVRLPPPGTGASGLAGLTEREADVVRLIARGLSNAEIAQELFLSTATIKTHINRVLAKLGLRDRVQLVVRAYESGLIRPGST
jgi:DNA-binding NarL/FixJ family response regulator